MKFVFDLTVTMEVNSTHWAFEDDQLTFLRELEMKKRELNFRVITFTDTRLNSDALITEFLGRKVYLTRDTFRRLFKILAYSATYKLHHHKGYHRTWKYEMSESKFGELKTLEARLFLFLYHFPETSIISISLQLEKNRQIQLVFSFQLPACSSPKIPLWRDIYAPRPVCRRDFCVFTPQTSQNHISKLLYILKLNIHWIYWRWKLQMHQLGGKMEAYFCANRSRHLHCSWRHCTWWLSDLSPKLFRTEKPF